MSIESNKEALNSILNALKERDKKLNLGGGEAAIEKQHAQGKLTARERILALVDEGSFEEIDKEDDDFKVNLKLDFGDKNLLNMFISIGFSGGEMSGKLNSKYKFELSDDFNYTISKN